MAKDKNEPKIFDASTARRFVKDRIRIHESEKIPKEGVFVSLNGHPYLIKPGEEVDIPRPVREMLDTRIQTQTLQGEDGKDYRKDIPRITYTLVKEGINLPENMPNPEVIGSAVKTVGLSAFE